MGGGAAAETDGAAAALAWAPAMETCVATAGAECRDCVRWLELSCAAGALRSYHRPERVNHRTSSGGRQKEADDT